MIKKREGISLVALVITIIVLIILTSTIMIMFNQGGMIGRAEEATFKSDFSNILDSFMLYKNELMLERLGNVNDIKADNEEKIKEYIPLLANNNKVVNDHKYTDLIQIYDSKIYQSDDIAKLSNEKDKEISKWLEEIGITILNKPSKTDVVEIANDDWVVEKINGIYTITGYNGTESNQTKLIIPNKKTIDNEEVNIESIRAFGASSKFKNVEEIIIPEGIERIDSDFIFSGVNNLKSVELPSTLEFIYDSAFYNCQSLESIVIPNNVTYVGANVFYNCTSLKSVVLSENITNLSDNVFRNTAIENIIIPDNVMYIESLAFYGCLKLENVIFSENSKLKLIGYAAFGSCIELSNIQIPNTVTTIKQGAFGNCTSFTQITIPSSVNTVEQRIFRNCIENLKINVNKKRSECTGFDENWNNRMSEYDSENYFYNVLYLPE